MAVAALSVITANPVVIMAAESKEGQTVKPTDTNTPSEKIQLYQLILMINLTKMIQESYCPQNGIRTTVVTTIILRL